MRRFAITVLVFGVLGVIGFGAYKYFTTSRIEVTLADANVPLKNAVIRVDDVRATKTADATYTATVGRGEHHYSVHIPGYTYAEESFSTTFKTTFQFSPKITPAAPDAVAQTIYTRVAKDFTIARARFYGDKDWLVFYVGSPNTEGSIVVAHFDAQRGDWTIVSEGTEVSLGEAASSAPGDMLFDLKDVLEQ